MIGRRTLLGGGIAALSVPAASYARILGANDRLRVAVMGLNGRGTALMKAVAGTPNNELAALIDVDQIVLAKRAGETQSQVPRLDRDYRRALDRQDIDALVVTTPDHWHVKASIDALAAGKHVYVEKPLGLAPAEGEALIAAQRRANRVVQMGNQQRSSQETQALVALIRQGALGDVYQADTWYANNRGTIGKGSYASPPAHLDWDLWQGPLPRGRYRTNLVHYNWHWFWQYGTGEITNNALHELDIARWIMDVVYPEQVTARGSRRFHRGDDWEMYDTLALELAYGDGRMIRWDGHSCNAQRRYGRDRGVLVYGTRGTAIVDRNGYELFGLDGKSTGRAVAAAKSATTNTVGAGDLDLRHFANFADTVRGTAAGQASPVLDGHISTTLCHLGNMAYRTGKTLRVDPATGRPLDAAAMKLWAIDYEPGWALTA
ncbi:Gfo/Idh/MocA family oxidoreductase [Sphingomonas suaedae]|uniref:Gfo/Idh/MocA family oxidoreductase n=1 Tax=Sphingomonas suaedae TaxID=2599297 RepID=A0A518RHF5_9SPHN|nr:Gfo/Idh/MocA family oxidoreductase [Sphingomonas suaedae]QDX26893.1 Gfo/Idh/MocA family oxidoreductase [Sphingomonas suaedae]